MIDFLMGYVFSKMLDKLVESVIPSKVMASNQITNLNIIGDKNIIVLADGKSQLIESSVFRDRLTIEEKELFETFLKIIKKSKVEIIKQGGEYTLRLSGKMILKEALTYDDLYKRAVLRQEKIPVQSLQLDPSLERIVGEEQVEKLLNSENIVLHSLTQPKKFNVQLKIKSSIEESVIYSEKLILSCYDYDSEQIILGNHLSTNIIQIFISISLKHLNVNVTLNFKNKKYFTTQELRYINNIERFLARDKSLKLIIESNDKKELISGIYKVSDSFMRLFKKEKAEFIDLLEKIEEYFLVTLKVPPIEKFTKRDWDTLEKLQLAFNKKEVRAKVSGPIKLRLMNLQPEIQKTYLKGSVMFHENLQMELFNVSLKGIRKILCFENVKEKGASSREPLKFRKREADHTEITFHVYGDRICRVKYILLGKKV